MCRMNDAASKDEVTSVLQAVRENRLWYHTIELSPGRTTQGHVDLRRIAPRVLPARLDGLRALDIGTYDGFWAFELEARGAREVIATDLEDFDFDAWPPETRARWASEFEGMRPSDRFHIAHRERGSSVRHVGCSIYDLDTDRLGGPVDFAVIGALLLHLLKPVEGLEAARRVMNPGARLLLVEPFDVAGTLLRPLTPTAQLRAHRTPYDWWLGNLAYLRRVLLLAGFRSVRPRRLFRLDGVPQMRVPFVALEARVPASA
jgi:tRNA (mo5U34)-methyltransferase